VMFGSVVGFFGDGRSNGGTFECQKSNVRPMTWKR